MDSTILVTGSAGFIGSRVSEFLLREGYKVIGLDNFSDAYDVRLKRWRLERLEGRDGFTFCPVDICDRDGLREVFDDRFTKNGRFDAVINLAARAGVRQSVENPWVYYETNVTGTLNLLELCRAFGSKKFVLASTSSLYGAHNPVPFREDADTDRPLSPYAASKKAAETLCHTYHYLYGIDTTVFRYFTVYGPGGRPDMSLFRFVQWISEGRPVIVFGDGGQSRDFTYVDDIARGTIAGLRPLGHEVINLGSDRPVVLREAMQQIENLTGRRAAVKNQPRHPADVMSTWADVSKAERILGWKPETRFEEGLQHLVSWYKANREWARDIKTE